MSPEFRSLLRKEWSERRRLFLFGLGLMALYLGYCVAYELEYRTRAFVASFSSTCGRLGWIGAVLLAMSAATGEYSERSLRFSASLPVSLRKIAWARLLGAWACLAGVMVLGALLVTPLLASGFFEQAGLRAEDYSSGPLPNRPSLSQIEAVGFLWTTTAIDVVSAIYLVTLISLLGTTCRSEGAVGFLGAIVVLISKSLTLIRSHLDTGGLYLLSDWIGGLFPGALAIDYGYGDLDGSLYTDLELAPLILWPLVINFTISVGLGAWFARRYGCRLDFSRPVASGRTRRWIPRMPSLLSRLGVRWHLRGAALAWLNARQSVPLCLAGLTMAVLSTGIGLSASQGRGTLPARLAGELPSSTWYVGLVWGAIVAVGIFSSEFKPELEQFWRSRPISPSAWFWTKFAVGLVALLTTLDLIPAWLARTSHYQSDTGRVGVAYAACFPLLHTFVYALAVAAICRLRRPIPAAITALLLYFAFDHILESIPVYPRLSPLNVYNQLEHEEWPPDPIEGVPGPGWEAVPVDLTDHGYPLVYGLVAAGILGATVFARRAAILPRAGRLSLWATALIFLCPAADAHAAARPSPAEIAAEIRRREELPQNIHLRVSTRHLQTAASFEFNDAVNHRLRGRMRPAQDREERRIYEYFNRPPRRAWTEFDTDGRVRSKVAYDGFTRQRFEAGQSRGRNEGSVSDSPHPPTIPFLNPENLARPFGVPWLASLPPDSLHWRDDGGEQLLEFNFESVVMDDIGSRELEKRRIQVTVNVSRDCWPVRIQHDTTLLPDGGLSSRTVVTAHDWIDAGTMVYPKRIERESYVKACNRPTGSDELVLAGAEQCDVEVVELNAEIPDSVFATPFPPGAIYYDGRDQTHYENDASGQPQRYVPKPRGIRGAVLAYHILWITAAVVYCVCDSLRMRKPGVEA